MANLDSNKLGTFAGVSARDPNRSAPGGGNPLPVALLGKAADAALDHLLATLCRQLKAYSASVWLKTEEAGEPVLELCFQHWLRNAPMAVGSLEGSSLPQELAQKCIRTRRLVLSRNVAEAAENGPCGRKFLAGRALSQMVIPLLQGRRVVGLVCLSGRGGECFGPEARKLAQAVTRQTALTLQLICLAGNARQAAVLEERCRLAQELHDTLAQGFTGVIVQLDAAEGAFRGPTPGEAEGHLKRAGELARRSLVDVRRAFHALRPQALEHNSLPTALQRLLLEMTAGTPVTAEFHLEGRERPLLAELEENLLRISQEALTNTLRHAAADRFEVRLEFASNEVLLHLRDNGRGFDPRLVNGGLGLTGIRERAERIGARLDIWSLAKQGTGVRVALTDNAALRAVA